MMDLYQVLGVARDAEPTRIHKAYLKLAKTHHPDAGGDAEAFKAIEEAHRVLTDPAARAFYDASGEPPPAQGSENGELYAMLANFVTIAALKLEQPTASDLIATMKYEMRSRERQMREEISKGRESLARYQIVAARIKTKKPENTLRGILLSHVDVLQKNIAEVERMLAVMVRGFVWLDDYSYDSDKLLGLAENLYRPINGVGRTARGFYP